MEIVVPDEFKYLYETNAERPVVKIPEPVLRQVCTPVEEVTNDIRDLAKRMTAAMEKANGVGLAAPQLGSTHRVVVMAPGSMKPLLLINPRIREAEGLEAGQEGCLSIPGLYGDVERATRVIVEAYDIKGKPVEYEMEDLAARVIQHEIDHLEGVLFIDKVDIGTLHWMHPEGAITE